MKYKDIKNNIEKLTKGEAFFDDITREIYSTAADLYRIKPLGVVRPRNASEISDIIKFCSENRIPITARGAGSGVAGQSIGEGIILDFTRFMNRILRIDLESMTAHVEPGVILSSLNSAAKRFGLHFCPDPSSGDYATIGGMVANNSSGPHAIVCGSTRDHLAALEVVLADGTRAEFSKKDLSSLKTSGAFEAHIYDKTVSLLRTNAEIIERLRPRVKNSSGYLVWDVLDGDTVDFTKLTAGSEGTLAVVTAATLKLKRLPAARAGVIFLFKSLEHAGEAVSLISSRSPGAIEIMDRQFAEVVRQNRPDLADFLPEGLECLLLVEFEGASQQELQSRLKDMEHELVSVKKLAFDSRPAKTEKELDTLWEVRKAASPILYSLKGKKRLTRFVEDIVIPPEKIADGLKQVQKILADHGTSAPILGHAGDGNLHLNPKLDLENPEDRVKMQDIAEDIYDYVISLGGAISGEHGDGILRAPYVKKQFKELYQVFEEIKRIFDPNGILNPGKILSSDERMPVSNLRFNLSKETGQKGFHGKFLNESIHEAIIACHGCGMCRTYCPAFLADPKEEYLPRSRVDIVRALVDGELDAGKNLASGAADDVLSTCFSCQRCLTQCKTGVEVARLAGAAKAERKKDAGFSARDYSLGRVERILQAASIAPGFEKAALSSKPLRGLMERALGIRRDAPLPIAASGKPPVMKKSSAAEMDDNVARKVLYYPGCLDRYASRDNAVNDIIEMLGKASDELIVPELPCCGLPLAATDDLEAARKKAAELAEKLKPYLDKGFLIVTACPGCALTFRREYPVWLGERGMAAAGAAMTFFEYMAGAIQGKDIAQRALKKNMEFAYHRPCHDMAVNVEDHVKKTLYKIQGLKLHELPSLCCGMGGTFGVKTETAEVSGKIAQALKDAIIETGVSRVISSCGLCRLQIEGMGFEAARPEKILAEVLLR